MFVAIYANTRARMHACMQQIEEAVCCRPGVGAGGGHCLLQEGLKVISAPELGHFG